MVSVDKRIKAIKREKSSLLKVVALVADQPSSKAKSRRSLLGRHFSYLGWLIVFAFYSGATFYIVKFAASRNVYARDKEETESYYIVLWLITAAIGVAISYLVAEPTISMIRYVL